ncbi:MAG TPA: hypothetical protein VNF03_16270 [Patescibacteria group bacterium]|nr:hypothetical protein [Patescibacteria group bacterium]
MMMRSRIPVGMALALVAAAFVLPTTASADGRRGGGGGASVGASGGRSGGSVGRPGFNNGFNNRGFNHHRFNSNSVIFVGPSPFWYSSPYYSSPPVVYAPPPVYIAPQFIYQAPPPAAYYPTAPSAPPGPRVVEFPTGRYELRGDGVATPYSWVWVPNPPSAPPGPPPAPAAPEAPPVAPSSRPANRMTIYRWTDDNGVTVLTDDINSVPEQYRIQLVNRTKL